MVLVHEIVAVAQQFPRFAFNPVEKARILSGGLRAEMKQIDSYFPRERYFGASKAMDFLNQMEYVDYMHYLPDDIMVKVDRMSMANSLEVRVPLLDHQIVEMAFSLPLSLRIRLDPLTREVETKILFKRSAARFLPKSFLSRPKHGFGIPVIEWCRGPLMPFLKEALLDAHNLIFDWVRPQAVEGVLEALLKGDGGASARLWSLLMLHLWAKEVHQR